MEIMLARAASFERARPELSPQGQAFVDRVLDPEHGFAVTARRTYEAAVSAFFPRSAGEDGAYRDVYALVPGMWQEAGYYDLPLSDIWTLSKAEARAVTARVAFTHPSARHMAPVRLRRKGARRG